jgi:hypothetical protein
MDTTIEKTVLREICAHARQQVWNKFKKPSHVFIVDGTEYKFKSKSAVKKTKVSKKKDRNLLQSLHLQQILILRQLHHLKSQQTTRQFLIK